MPHGVLFRGAAEKQIRKKFLQQELIEAVIGLPQNLFYGAGIPACILVMRPNKPAGRPIRINPPSVRARCAPKGHLGELLFEFHVPTTHRFWRVELRHHGDYGVEVPLFDPMELRTSRMFKRDLDPTRTPPEFGNRVG